MTQNLMPDLQEFEKQIAEHGWYHFSSVLPADWTDEIRSAVDDIYASQRDLQIANGVGDNLTGAVHCLPGHKDATDRFLTDLPLRDYLSAFFGKDYILNNYGAVINFPRNDVYVNRPHRDVRDFTYPTRIMMNMMVMVDDFTIENGATKILAGSHKDNTPITEDDFNQKCQRLTGKAGDIVLWDSNLLHAAGTNTSDMTRRALTLCFCRPYIKPTIEFRYALDQNYLGRQSDFVKSLLGLDAQPAHSLNEFYQPKEKWTYKMS